MAKGGLALLAVSRCLLSAEPVCAQPHSLGEMDREWQGSLTIVGTSYEDPLGPLRLNDTFELRFEVAADAARVLALLPQWKELRVRRFVRRGPSAMVIADTQSAYGTETWTLNVTKRDETSVIVAITRSVRSPSVGSENAEALVVQAVGELRERGDE
jgi:hypothetical protein